ncbi:MAG: hypothetical protein WDO73_01250 [Ignavibacteriota bacterium]
MARDLDYLPRLAIFLAGIAAGALTSARRPRSNTAVPPAGLEDLKKAISTLESRFTAQDTATAERF